jgi:putative ABC transport system permease protein
MLRNYFKIAIKVLIRRKFFTAISLFGIGFTLTILLVVVAMVDSLLAPSAPETNLDRTLQVYGIAAEAKAETESWVYMTSAGYALLDRYARDIPGVERLSIFTRPANVSSFVGGEKVVSSLRHTDGAYWEILRFRFLEGSSYTDVDDREGNFVAVISEATRRRFFGESPAAGRDIEADGQRFRVIGVVENVPMFRRSASGDIWVPHGTAKSQAFRTGTSSSFYSGSGFQGLLLARSRSDFPRIKAEFQSRLQHVELQPPNVALRGLPLTRLEQYAIDMAIRTPDDGHPPVGQLGMQLSVFLIAFLLLPTTNLININLSRFMERTQEIGVRKTFGATRADLAGQFILENVFLCLIGGGLALIAAAWILRWIEANGWIPYADFEINFQVFLYALGLACGFGVLTGAYPAWRTSRLHPVEALRGGVR